MPEPSEPYDVAIAGSGLAGASLALRLARRGVRVAVLDAAVFPRPKLCGEYISPEGVEALDRLGLVEATERAAGEPITRVRLTTPRGTLLEAEVARPGEASGLGLSRAMLDEQLVRAAQAAGAEFFPDTRVLDVLSKDGRATGLIGKHPESGRVEIMARLTVIANGRNSTLVRQTGQVRVRSRLRPAYFGLKRHLRAGAAEIDEPAGCVGLHLLPGGYVGACRVEGGVTNLCGLLPEAWLQRHRGQLDAMADAHFPANPVLQNLWQGSEPVDAWKTVAGVRVQRARPKLDDLLYVGDAQGTVDPLGGQGMTMALLGAEIAEAHLLQALGRPEGCTAVNRAYAREWHHRFDHRVHLCRLFHHLLVRPTAIDGMAASGQFGRQLLALGFRLTRDPVRRSFASLG